MAESVSEAVESSNSQSTVSSNACSNVSRRRLAFRPHSVKPLRIMFDSTQPSTSANADQSKTDGGGFKVFSTNSIDCETQQQSNSHQQQHFQKSRRRLGTNWSFQEGLVFYDGLKQNGKDFEMIARYMTRKKFNKDRDQIRNYYFNAFKIWKAKAQMEEHDWNGVPRDARELFVVFFALIKKQTFLKVLNGCEWRKKTGSANFDAAKFKTLIMEGSTSVRIKKKKSLVTIRTPYCPCLLKFFPYDKRNAEIPTHLSLKLTPLRYIDRNFVISSEQNPLLHLRVNINDKIVNIFELLEKKWTTPIKKLANLVGVESNVTTASNLTMRLRVTDGVQIHKVQVDLNSENFPLMSLRKLKRDYNGDREDTINTKINNQTQKQVNNACQFSCTSFLADENSNEAQKNYVAVKPNKAKDCNIIKLGFSAIKEVFDLDEAKLKEGMTKESVCNASVLQLFYLCGMTSEILLTYEICESPANLELSWRYFVSLVSRDYGELIAKSLSSQQQQIYASNLSTNNRVEDDGDTLESNSNDAVCLENHDTTTLKPNLVLHFDGNFVGTTKRKRGKNLSCCSAASNPVATLLKTGTTALMSSDVRKDETGNHISSVVEKENAQFLEQIRAIQQQHTSKRAKRQVKVLPNPKRGKNSFGLISNNQRSVVMQQSHATNLDSLKSQQQLLHHQNIPVVEIATNNNINIDSSVNNEFCGVLQGDNFIQTDQPFTYLITSSTPEGRASYSTNSGTIINENQLTNFQPHHPIIYNHEQTTQPEQLSSIIYQAQEIVSDSQPVFAFVQNDGNAVSVLPVVTTVELNNQQQQYSNLTECSIETIPALTTGLMVNDSGQLTSENSSAATLYLAHNPPPPTDFSHFAMASTTTNLELQSFIPVSETTQSSSSCLQPFSSSTISASFRSPTKAGYNKRHSHFRSTGSNSNLRNHNSSQNDIIILADSELTNTSVGDFSIDSLSAFVGCSSATNSGAGNQQTSSSILLLDSSPSKTLPEDVRNAYEQMLKENSIDYCRNFEQLTRNMDIIHKNVCGNLHDKAMHSGADTSSHTSSTNSNVGMNKGKRHTGKGGKSNNSLGKFNEK